MAKPDDRSDNIRKLQGMTQDTIQNIQAAEESLENQDMTNEQRRAIKAKNERREESINSFREEIRDEYDDSQE
ncbi:small, acid-soluble spore protein tlp [Desulfofarcimen acetoxidans DSM 771]|uniref:Protein Tlp homolog n=1 Tax=Desulfofarcimen acetoxidans (strain ATCC 49208 / DSM 771 / KCTC 5769 / VKM B-1644 / 5575) TaxID=485916 RepID=C8W214_DESAS|nr:small acid-soluble spore protein Tlp [Desulfofarcimen acetoxidans]ACV61678.1 small, acid-soluble spore protein tlp [Desulfofarcimen acetoxidans DSM 771]